MLKCAKLKISGRVQGVFFRDFTEEKANELELVGWVKNMPDDTVEVQIQGDKAVIEQMIAWCHKGSPGAQVDKVEVEWVDAESCEGFEVRY